LFFYWGDTVSFNDCLDYSNIIIANCFLLFVKLEDLKEYLGVFI